MQDNSRDLEAHSYIVFDGDPMQLPLMSKK